MLLRLDGHRAEVKEGYDLVLTEILDGEHRLLVEAGTERGRDVPRELTGRSVEGDDLAAAEAAVDGAAERMGRTLEAGGLQDLSAGTLEHPRWNDVAYRCLTCGNCTMVCPTCFCSSVEDVAEPRPALPLSVTACGTRASPSTTRTSTAAASGRAEGRAIASG